MAALTSLDLHDRRPARGSRRCAVRRSAGRRAGTGGTALSRSWPPQCRIYRGRLPSDATTSKLVHELGLNAVPHGFRSSFRDWAAETTDTPHAVMEAALAHTIRNAAEAAYARSGLFARPRVLMDWWAEHVKGGSVVIPICSAA